MDQSIKDLILIRAIKELSTLKYIYLDIIRGCIDSILIHQLGMEEKDLTEEDRKHIVEKVIHILNGKGELYARNNVEE